MPQAQGIRIGRVLGIPIYIDLSWIIIFGLITYLISAQFAQLNSQWTATQVWTLAAATSLLFFGSVLFHELRIAWSRSTTRSGSSPSRYFCSEGWHGSRKNPARPYRNSTLRLRGRFQARFLAECFTFRR